MSTIYSEELAAAVRTVKHQAAELSRMRAALEEQRGLLALMREEHRFHHYIGCLYDEEPDVPCTCFIGPLHAKIDAAIAERPLTAGSGNE